MQNFDELIFRSTSFTLHSLGEMNAKIIEQLQTSSSTELVNNLQMVQLQKAIFSIGIFSLFESILQDNFSCRNGFKTVEKILKEKGKVELYNHFDEYYCAINVLKHGKGKSYDKLVSKSNDLPFRIKLPEERYFEEGDISEVSTLIEVNDSFVLNCAKIIEKVSRELKS